MLGIFRTTLAAMVMVFHLWMDTPPLGGFAVFGFYVISGYLMTLTMHTSYGDTAHGRLAFAVNRFLRLYPPYWLAAGLSIVLILDFGGPAVRAYHDSIYLPGTLREVLQNVGMLFVAFHPVSVDPRLVPPTWALTVEIFFYALICAGISKSLPRVLCWLALSVLYVVVTVALGWPERDRYFPAAAASLPFSLGALVFFATRSQRIRDRWQRLGLRLPLLAGLMVGNLAVWMIVSKTGASAWTEVGQYVNVALCSLVVYALAVSPRPAAISAQMDQRIGDFSYPIYLLHWQCGLVASMLLFGGATPPKSLNGLAVLLLASVFVAILSMLFIRHVDPALQALRGRVRPAERQGAGA